MSTIELKAEDLVSVMHFACFFRYLLANPPIGALWRPKAKAGERGGKSPIEQCAVEGEEKLRRASIAGHSRANDSIRRHTDMLLCLSPIALACFPPVHPHAFQTNSTTKTRSISSRSSSRMSGPSSRLVRPVSQRQRLPSGSGF